MRDLVERLKHNVREAGKYPDGTLCVADWSLIRQTLSDAADEIANLRAALATRTAERDEALKALEPFGKIAGRWEVAASDYMEVGVHSNILVGDLRTAARILAKHQPKGDQTDG